MREYMRVCAITGAVFMWARIFGTYGSIAFLFENICLHKQQPIKKPVWREVEGTVILPPTSRLVFPARSICNMVLSAKLL